MVYMAVPLMPRLAWGRLTKGLKKKANRIVRDRAMMGIAKLRRREIAKLAAELNIPANRLREYFNRLKLKNMSFEERCDTMVKTLGEMKELAIKTEINAKKLREFVEKNGIEWVRNEMAKRSQEMDAMQGQAAA